MIRPVLIFISVLVGVFILYSGHIVLNLLTLIIVTTVTHAGRTHARSIVLLSPKVAAYLFEFSVLIPLAFISLSTIVTTTIAIMLPGWINISTPDEVKIVSGVIVGGLSALVGALILTKATDPEGDLWPSAQHRAAIREKMKNDPRVAGDTRLHDAIYMPNVRGPKGIGWGFSDRLRRVEIINEELNNSRNDF